MKPHKRFIPKLAALLQPRLLCVREDDQLTDAVHIFERSVCSGLFRQAKVPNQMPVAKRDELLRVVGSGESKLQAVIVIFLLSRNYSP